MKNISDVRLKFVGNCAPHYYFECTVAYWLWRTVPLILLFIGTIGNILSIIVLSRPQLRKYTTSILLLLLALSDLTVLWTSLLPDTLYSITKFRFVDQSEVICRLQYWVSLTSGGFSVWLLVLLTIERTLVTKAPIFSRKRLTPRLVLITSVIVCILIALINVHLCFGLKIYPPIIDFVSDTNGSTVAILTFIEFPCNYVSVDYQNFFEGTWSIFMLVFYTLIPAVIIFIGNVNIGILLITRRKRFFQVHPEGQIHEGISDKTKSVTKMLFVLSFVFLATTLPYCLYIVVKGKTSQISDRDVSKWQLFSVISHVLLWCNFTFNFFYYFVSGTLFKKEWNRLIEKAKRYFKNQSTEFS